MGEDIPDVDVAQPFLFSYFAGSFQDVQRRRRRLKPVGREVSRQVPGRVRPRFRLDPVGDFAQTGFVVVDAGND